MTGPRTPSAKIVSRDQLLRRFGRPRTRSLVFTNGCFDVLHRGHVAYLAQARARGETLVVAINSDASVRRLKGPDRPLLPAEDRAYVLAGLESVDAVTIFDEDTPLGLITDLLPDVLAKGGDYAREGIVGRAEVEAVGGEVVVIPYLLGHSSTAIIQRLREASP